MKSELFSAAVWIAVPFNLFAALVLLYGLIETRETSEWLMSSPHEVSRLAFGYAVRFFGFGAVLAFAAATILLLRRTLPNRRRAAVCQRFGFLCLLLFVILNIVRAFLPSENGMDILGLIVGVAMFGFLTLGALLCVWLVTGWSRQETREEDHE